MNMQPLPDATLIAMGFECKTDQYKSETWSYAGRFFYQILTPESVKDIFLALGREEARKQICEFIEEQE